MIVPVEISNLTRFNGTIKVVDKDINPYVDKWEKEKIFPAHQVFKKMGDVGIFGIEREPGWVFFD